MSWVSVLPAGRVMVTSASLTLNPGLRVLALWSFAAPMTCVMLRWPCTPVKKPGVKKRPSASRMLMTDGCSAGKSVFHVLRVMRTSSYPSAFSIRSLVLRIVAIGINPFSQIFLVFS